MCYLTSRQYSLLKTLIEVDKPLSMMALGNKVKLTSRQDNYNLGMRGVHLSPAYPDLLRQPLRAIYRTTREKSTHIIFPKVADFNEWKSIRHIAEEVRCEVHAPEAEPGINVEIIAAETVLFETCGHPQKA